MHPDPKIDFIFPPLKCFQCIKLVVAALLLHGGPTFQNGPRIPPNPIIDRPTRRPEVTLDARFELAAKPEGDFLAVGHAPCYELVCIIPKQAHRFCLLRQTFAILFFLFVHEWKLDADALAPGDQRKHRPDTVAASGNKWHHRAGKLLDGDDAESVTGLCRNGLMNLVPRIRATSFVECLDVANANHCGVSAGVTQFLAKLWMLRAFQTHSQSGHDAMASRGQADAL